MKFLALGDTEDIAASCHFLEIDGTGIVLDSGTDPRHDGPDSLPKFEWVRDRVRGYVDHAIITHAHHDHMGSLPVLVEEYPHVMAHMTDATKQLLEFLLPASARLQKKRYDQNETTHEPLFTEDDLSFQSQIYLTHELEETFDLTGMQGDTPVTGRFYSAGHILGSVGVELVFEEQTGDGAAQEKRLFYTSDTNMQPQSIIPGGEYPSDTDILMLETTLGADEAAEQTSRPEEYEKFRDTLSRVIDRGGTAIVPVFVMGRAQEMLAMLQRLKEEGHIPSDVPIYTAGSMRAIAGLYDDTRKTTPRLNEEFKVYDVEQERVPYGSDEKKDVLDGPGIMVVSSGMMFEPTLSNVLARRVVENERDAVLIVGHAVEGTPARRLQEAAAEGPGAPVMLAEGHGPQPVYCTVERFRFSGHSHRRDLLQIVDRLAPDTVLLVHGEPAAQEWMQEAIEEQHPGIDVRRPEWGDLIEL